MIGPTGPVVRVLHDVGPVDLVRTCRPLADGGADPTWRITPDRVVRARWTPDGPATVEVRRDAGGTLACRAWGPGAEAALDDGPAMVGAHDDDAGFRPELHPVVAAQARLRPDARFGAGRSVWDAAVPQVLGQRVTTREARRSWWQLVRRYGSAAPGSDEVRLGPSPARLLALGDADWHVLGVERRRADAVRAVARVVGAAERAARVGSAELQRVLVTLPGIGRWTATGLAITVLGDPDTVLLGDLHVPHNVCHALAGEPRGSDDRMLELLAPWAGHRGRVVRLLGGSGRHAPRRGPRYTPLPIARW